MEEGLPSACCSSYRLSNWMAAIASSIDILGIDFIDDDDSSLDSFSGVYCVNI